MRRSRAEEPLSRSDRDPIAIGEFAASPSPAYEAAADLHQQSISLTSSKKTNMVRSPCPLVLDHSTWAARSKNGTPFCQRHCRHKVAASWIRCLSATSQDVCASCLPVVSYHYSLYYLYHIHKKYQKNPMTFQSSLVISCSPDLLGIEPNTSSRSPDCWYIPNIWPLPNNHPQYIPRMFIF